MTDSKTVRLFLGSPLEGPAKTALEGFYAQREQLTRQWESKLSWVRPETYHMTWLFIGEVAPKKVEALIRRTGQCLAGQNAMDLVLDRLVFWPNARHPRLLVWQGTTDHPQVQEVTGRLRAEFPGYADSKPFKPHITVARIRQAAGPLAPPDPMPPETWHIGQITLYQSLLDPKGAIHHPLNTWLLE